MQQANQVVRTAWISLVVNVLLQRGAHAFLKHAGIALASSISVAVQMVMLSRILTRQGITLSSEVWSPVGKMAGAVAAMGAGLFWFVRMEFWTEGLNLMSLSLLASSIGLGAAVYFALLWIMGMRNFGR